VAEILAALIFVTIVSLVGARLVVWRGGRVRRYQALRGRPRRYSRRRRRREATEIQAAIASWDDSQTKRTRPPYGPWDVTACCI